MKAARMLAAITLTMAILALSLAVAPEPAAAQITIPAGTTITSATLWIYVENISTVSSQTISVHRVTAPWTEMDVTWNSFGASYDLSSVGSFTNAPRFEFKSTDVTALVQGWVDGTYPNYGLLLDEGESGSNTTYWSSEHSDVSLRPKLEVCFDGSCVTIQRPAAEQDGVADTCISEKQPDTNFGASNPLYTGYVNELEKQTLIWFDLVTVPSDGGCTLTPGYWKTHSAYGPASYDDAWALIVPDGEDTPFFLSGQTYYQVLWTSPAGGNAYYILAHAYIAAKLNILSGASSTPEVDAAIDAAEDLFGTYAPDQVSILDGEARAQFLSLATLLDDYNNGLIGPGHCPA